MFFRCGSRVEAYGHREKAGTEQSSESAGNPARKTKKENGMGGGQEKEAPAEIESGSATSEGPRRGDTPVELPCVATDMSRRDNAASKEPMQTRPGASEKEALYLRASSGFVDSAGGALCAPSNAIASAEMSARITQSVVFLLFGSLVRRPIIPASDGSIMRRRPSSFRRAQFLPGVLAAAKLREPRGREGKD